MNDSGNNVEDEVLATSTLCTVTKLEGDMLEIEIGAAVLRMPARDVASLTGTLQRVVKRVFKPAPARVAARAYLTLVRP